MNFYFLCHTLFFLLALHPQSLIQDWNTSAISFGIPPRQSLLCSSHPFLFVPSPPPFVGERRERTGQNCPLPKLPIGILFWIPLPLNSSPSLLPAWNSGMTPQGLWGFFAVGRKSGTMCTFDPQNDIGNQFWARCCGRAARLEPHIASEKIHTLYLSFLVLQISFFIGGLPCWNRFDCWSQVHLWATATVGKAGVGFFH